LVGAGLQPPDIDTALRIDTKKAGSRRPFFVRMPERLRLAGLAARILSAPKKNFALHATFRHDALL
jgi:hypothetical protein